MRKHVMNMFEYLLWSQENHLNRNICSLMRFGSKTKKIHRSLFVVRFLAPMKQQCSVEAWRSLMAQNKHDHLPSKTASMLHDANLRLFMAEVKRCHRSFEDFIEECRQKNLPDETTSVNSEENLKPAGCFIVECETLVVRL